MEEDYGTQIPETSLHCQTLPTPLLSLKPPGVTVKERVNGVSRINGSGGFFFSNWLDYHLITFRK